MRQDEPQTPQQPKPAFSLIKKKKFLRQRYHICNTVGPLGQLASSLTEGRTLHLGLHVTIHQVQEKPKQARCSDSPLPHMAA